jgi:Smg protein
LFDILIFLVERFFSSGGYPDADTLSRHLTAAGFDEDEIRQALSWLSGLERDPVAPDLPTAGGLRHFSPLEQRSIDVPSRSFLLFMQRCGVLSSSQREMVIERILALDVPEAGLDHVKLVVLLVLWNQRQVLDSLILDELLAGSRTPPLH